MKEKFTLAFFSLIGNRFEMYPEKKSNKTSAGLGKSDRVSVRTAPLWNNPSSYGLQALYQDDSP